MQRESVEAPPKRLDRWTYKVESRTPFGQVLLEERERLISSQAELITTQRSLIAELEQRPAQLSPSVAPEPEGASAPLEKPPSEPRSWWRKLLGLS